MPQTPHAPFRDTAPDALFGALVVLEAAVGVLLRERVASAQGIDRSATLAELRRDVEAGLAARQRTSKFGAGREAIDDAVAETLENLFGPVSAGDAARGRG
jgi:hypothetical protein